MNRLARAMLGVCVAAVLCAHVPATAAQAPAAGPSMLEVATQAQAAYDRGIELRRTDPTASLEAFRQSARDWQRVVDSGASNGPLHFNLGNAYMQAGDLGRAVASYIRAERSIPGDQDLKQNLAQARSRVEHSFARDGGALLVDSVARWWHILPIGVRQAAAWLAWFIFWGTLLLQLLAPRRVSRTQAHQSARKLVLGSSLILWCLFGGTLIADELLRTLRPQGVLVEPNVLLRKGNGEGFDPAFAESLSPGVEFSVLEERPGWMRIELPDSRSGWIKASQAEKT